jgi:mannobiose 2-epimerase
VEACIIEALKELSFDEGDTYSYIEEIIKKLSLFDINLSSEKLHEYLDRLNNRREIKIVEDKIFDSDNDVLRVFFDRKFELLGDIHSYGHDIEASWLTDRAVEVLGDADLIKRFNAVDLRLAEKIYSTARENGALNNERDGGHIDRKRVWWVQAEAVVGFLNAYQHSGDGKYLSAAGEIWDYIKEHIVDKREGGEWFNEVGFDGTPDSSMPMTGPWKCPYHNGRMCLEVLRRGVHL